MSQYWIIMAILLPIIGGVSVRFLPYKKKQELYMPATELLTTKFLTSVKTNLRDIFPSFSNFRFRLCTQDLKAPEFTV